MFCFYMYVYIFTNEKNFVIIYGENSKFEVTAMPTYIVKYPYRTKSKNSNVVSNQAELKLQWVDGDINQSGMHRVQ